MTDDKTTSDAATPISVGGGCETASVATGENPASLTQPSEWFRKMQIYNAEHCKRKGYRQIETDATPAERAEAQRALDIAECLAYDAIEARQMQAEFLEDLGVDTMMERGREPW